MARYDKYDGVTGGFRGESAAAIDSADFNKILGAGINASGKVVLKDDGVDGFKGVCIADRTKRRAGDILDVMTHGEIVMDSDEPGGLLTAGTTYFLNATTGALQTTATRYRVGHTVENWRLVVRFQDLYEIAGV